MDAALLGFPSGRDQSGAARMETQSSVDDAVVVTSSVPESVAASGLIRLLVCDGSALVRAEMMRLLAGHPSIKLVDCARNLREAVEKTGTLHPDVVVDVYKRQAHSLGWRGGLGRDAHRRGVLAHPRRAG